MDVCLSFSCTGIHWVLFHYLSVEPCLGTGRVMDECFSSQDTLWHISPLCTIRGIRGGSREGCVLFVKRPFSKIPWAAGATDTEQPH